MTAQPPYACSAILAAVFALTAVAACLLTRQAKTA